MISYRNVDVPQLLAEKKEQIGKDYVEYDWIPETMIRAIVAVEDRRFFDHHGIDPKGILRAIVMTIWTLGKHRQGGSTITQQLIKNTVYRDFENERTLLEKLKRKAGEYYLAPKLEKQMSKRDILEHYLNIIYYGQGCYGISNAAKTYFGKDARVLDLGECALLAGIPKNPEGYNPFRNYKRSLRRRNLVLLIMYYHRIITKGEYQVVKQRDIILCQKVFPFV